MPELPEVEAICRKLRREAHGAPIIATRVFRPSTTSPQAPDYVENGATGRAICAIERRGKNIVLRLSGGMALRVHLRMTGDLHVTANTGLRSASTRVLFELDRGRGLVFDDPRALGKVHLYSGDELELLLASIGPEPLSKQFTFEMFRSSARCSRLAAKLFLMDQRRVAGLGNIYAAEALFRARINPRRPMCRISAAKLAGLHQAIVEVMEEAVESAAAVYRQSGEFASEVWFPVAVYGREGEPCAICGRAIRRIPQGGRSTYYCATCQR